MPRNGADQSTEVDFAATAVVSSRDFSPSASPRWPWASRPRFSLGTKRVLGLGRQGPTFRGRGRRGGCGGSWDRGGWVRRGSAAGGSVRRRGPGRRAGAGRGRGAGPRGGRRGKAGGAGREGCA